MKTSFNRNCNLCQKFKPQNGSGIRFLAGIRQWVCAECKKEIDDSKKVV
jgi:hypothetical protein